MDALRDTLGRPAGPGAEPGAGLGVTLLLRDINLDPDPDPRPGPDPVSWPGVTLLLLQTSNKGSGRGPPR